MEYLLEKRLLLAAEKLLSTRSSRNGYRAFLRVYQSELLYEAIPEADRQYAERVPERTKKQLNQPETLSV